MTDKMKAIDYVDWLRDGGNTDVAEAIEALTADLAAARQRIERFKQYVPLVHGPDYDWCYVCEEPMPDKHAPTCPWAERGAEGGTPCSE